jgi:lipase maturation factor 1
VNSAGSYALTEALFLRLLGFVYLTAFGSLWPQIPGLLGSNGIAPVTQMLTSMHAALGAKAYFYVPSLFWWNSADSTLTFCCALGCLASFLLLAGLFPRYTAAACFILYLSLSTVGQPFTSFQWDALLLETGFLALFAGASWLVRAYRFLLFRLMFESGLVKLTSHDPNWRNLHALRYHFLTQPLPNPIAYYMYRAPSRLLDSLTGVTLAIELICPFLLFCPKRIRHCGVVLLMLLQVAIILTGNYAFFNLLTLALCLWAWDDATFTPLASLLRRAFPASLELRSKFTSTTSNAALAGLALLGLLSMVGVQAAWLQPFELVNRYGLFAVMTTTRPEIIIEGSDDRVTWKEYSFRYKPGNLHRDLPLVAPHQPRLDWQMWFAALGNYQESPWMQSLMYRLLRGDASVLALLDPPPFHKPPRYIRALLYMYDFTTPEERGRSGAVWRRELLGNWFGPVSLKE